MLEMMLDLYDVTDKAHTNEIVETLNAGWKIAYEQFVFDSKDNAIYLAIRWERNVWEHDVDPPLLAEQPDARYMLHMGENESKAVQQKSLPMAYPNTLDGFCEMVRAGDYVVLDTETTGLSDGEICQIAIVDANGEVLLDTLVKTTQPIPEGATYIHGITGSDVANAPTWAALQPRVRGILKGRNVVIYNATYDRKMMHKSDERAGLQRTDYKLEATYWDAMEHYAEHRGEWNDYHGNYRWQKLTNAARQVGISVENAHTALGDVLMTLAVIKAMATN
jgi:DNA polymerase III subunit epsilon